MKRVQFVFPLMFFFALAGSAFSRQTHSAKAGIIDAYYEDPNWNTCNEVQLDDDKCVSDNTGTLCQEYIGGLGFLPMWQAGFGNTCYMPFYQYP